MNKQRPPFKRCMDGHGAWCALVDTCDYTCLHQAYRHINVTVDTVLDVVKREVGDRMWEQLNEQVR